MTTLRTLSILLLICIASSLHASLLLMSGASTGGTAVLVTGIVPGTLAPGTCNPCSDSAVSTENYFYGNPWTPQQQPAQQGSPTSPYYDSDVMAQWSGPQLDTISTTTKKCIVGGSPSGAASGSPTDYGIDPVNFYVDGSDITGPSAPVVVSTASGDPEDYAVTSITGNGTTAVATLTSVPFAFPAPISRTGEGYGYHIAISGAGGFNGSYQLTASTNMDLTHANATVSFPSAFSGTVSGGTLNVTEPMYWCVTINPALFADGLHELRATVYPKIGWPRLMQGPHYIEANGANTSIDETNGSGIWTVPAHGWSYVPLTIDSVGSPGASHCLTPTGGNFSTAQAYSIALDSFAGMPASVRPAEPLRGYQFALYNTVGVASIINMQGCTDDKIIINDFRGTVNGGAQQYWMPYGGAAGSLLSPGFRNNHALWFFTNSHGNAFSATITVDGAAGSDTLGCGSSGSPCASIDGAIAFAPQLNPNDTTNTSAANSCTLAATANSGVYSTPGTNAGACNFYVGQAVYASTGSRGIHTGISFYIEGIAGQAAGTAILAGTQFAVSSIPVPSLSSAPTCPSATTFTCSPNAGTVGMHIAGDGITIILNGTPSAPQYYNYGSQPSTSANANLSRWFTIQGQSRTGSIINSSGHTSNVVDAANVVHQALTATWGTVSQQETVTFASSVAPVVGTSVLISGLACTGCGNPDGTALVVQSSTLTSVTVANSGLTPATSGTMPTPLNINVGNSFSWIHLQNLSVCGIDPAVNVSPLCSNVEPNPYSDVELAPGFNSSTAHGGLWVDSVSMYGFAGGWDVGGCVSITPCAGNNKMEGGVWFTHNDSSWNMGTGPLNDWNPGGSTAENMLFYSNLGQYTTTGLIRNITDDSLNQYSFSPIDCADWRAAGNPGGICNSSNLITVATNVVPVSSINKYIVTTSNNFTTTTTPWGGTYFTRFGWAAPGPWIVNVPATPTNVATNCINAGCNIVACYDVTGSALNCPAGNALTASCVTAGVSCLAFTSGNNFTTTAAAAAMPTDTGIHVDVFFSKDTSPSGSGGSFTDQVTVGLVIPDHVCDFTQVLTTCNASEGVISQAGVQADWAFLDLSLSQPITVALHLSEYAENIYFKNTTIASGFPNALAGFNTGRENGFFGGALMPPGGGEFGNGKLDGIVVDNTVCSPENQLDSGVPVYYGYWAKSIQGNGTDATMIFGDAGITIPAGKTITTQATNPAATSQIQKNSVVNPIYPTITAITRSGTSATLLWLPVSGNPLVEDGAQTMASANSVSLSGVDMLYTPGAVAYVGQAETISGFTPADTFPTATSVSLQGSTCSNCGTDKSADFDALLTTSVGKYTITAASHTLTTETVTFPTTFDVLTVGTSIKVSGLFCPVTTGAALCGGNPDGSFTVTASGVGTATFANTFTNAPAGTNLSELAQPTTLAGGTAGSVSVTNPNLGLYRISSGTWTSTGMTLNLAPSTDTLAGSITLAGLACSPTCGTVSGAFTVASASAGVVNITGLTLTGSGSFAGAGTLLSVPGTASASLSSPLLMRTSGGLNGGPFTTTAGSSGSITLVEPTTTAPAYGGSLTINGYATGGPANGFNVVSATSVGTTAGQVQFASTVNLPIMLDPSFPGAITGLAGFVIVPSGAGSGEDAISYMNSPAVDACVN